MRALHHTILITATLLAAFIGGLACDAEDGEHEGEGDELPKVDCQSVEVPRFEEMTVWSRCVGCHSSGLSGAARQGAPRDFNYDSHDAALFDPFETAEVVFEGEMPPAGTLTADEKAQLNAWVQCGTP
ncbi:MAG: hypothetical protein H6710_00795 [Myxococcales bacterium]|nr:hypothetical protein [Myxococcales bacterium]MCB9703092.1 hypothetical protein [Myxococcales bacterium]